MEGGWRNGRGWVTSDDDGVFAIDIEEIFPVGDRDENYWNAGDCPEKTGRIIEGAET